MRTKIAAGLFALTIITGTSQRSFATAVLSPAATVRSEAPGRISFHALEKLTGKKLTFKQKIAVRLVELSGRRPFAKPEQYDVQANARLALIFGIVGLAALLIPYVALVALPCALVALLVGYAVRRRDPFNRKARAATILGWITLGIFTLALLIVIAVLATFAWI
ncbi:MAG TPA: hypothetical protein VGC95_13320 [Chitinophagaceae bacterium]|jgi:hypothetical protein